MPGCSGPTATACPSPVSYGRSNSSSLTSLSTSRLALRFGSLRVPDVMLSRTNRLASSSVSPSVSSTPRYHPLTSRPMQGITSRTSYDVASHISPSSDWSYSTAYERRYSSTTGRPGRHSSISDDPDIVSTRYLSTRDRDPLTSSSTSRSTRTERCFDSRERETACNGGLAATSTRTSRDSTTSHRYTDSYSRSKSGSVDYGRNSRAISHDDTKPSATSSTSPSTSTARSRATSTTGDRPPLNSRFLKKIRSEREAANAAAEDADSANNNTNIALLNGGVSNDDNGNPERRSSVANLCRQFDPSPVARTSPKPSFVEKEEESPGLGPGPGAAAAAAVTAAAEAPAAVTAVAERNGTGGGPLVGGCAPQDDKPLVNGTARLSRIRSSSPAQSSDSFGPYLSPPCPIHCRHRTRPNTPRPPSASTFMYHRILEPRIPPPTGGASCSSSSPILRSSPSSLFAPTSTTSLQDDEPLSCPAYESLRRDKFKSYSQVTPLPPDSPHGYTSTHDVKYRQRVDIYDSPRIVRRPLSHTASTGASARAGGLNGLRNIGNTCFMNSVIQCLSNTRPLLEYLQKQNYISEINTTNSSMKGALMEAFAKMMKELWTGEDNIVDTTAFKRQIQHFAPRFMGYSQQDAQEFLRYLLEGLHEDVNRVETRPRNVLPDIDDSLTENQKADESWRRYLRLDDSAVVDIFVGQLKSTLRCTSCGHASVTFDPFWDLSLPLPSRTQLRLTQCLEHFTREEMLDGDEKPTCAKCKTRRKCTKSFSIQKFPKILVLHLKRFSPNERFRGKLSVNVEFPLTGLDLSEFAANRERASCTYNLYGVANHSGTTYSGHYTAYCKHPYSGDWHEYDDSKVSTISSRSIVSSEAYVLFYELARQSSHL